MNFRMIYFRILVFCFPFFNFASVISAQVKGSDRYTVEVRAKGQRLWKKLFVYQSINPKQSSQDISWSSFATAVPMELRICSTLQKVESVQIRPCLLYTSPSPRD